MYSYIFIVSIILYRVLINFSMVCYVVKVSDIFFIYSIILFSLIKVMFLIDYLKLVEGKE